MSNLTAKRGRPSVGATNEEITEMHRQQYSKKKALKNLPLIETSEKILQRIIGNDIKIDIPYDLPLKTMKSKLFDYMLPILEKYINNTN